MKTTIKTEVLGRNGETKADVLGWFQRRGFWTRKTDQIFQILNKLDARELDLLAGQITHYGLHCNDR